MNSFADTDLCQAVDGLALAERKKRNHANDNDRGRSGVSDEEDNIGLSPTAIPNACQRKLSVRLLDLPNELLREASYYISVRDCCAFALSHERLALLFDEAYWRARATRSLLNKNAQYPPFDPVLLTLAPSAATSRATSQNVSRSGSPSALRAKGSAENVFPAAALDEDSWSGTVRFPDPNEVYNMSQLSWTDICRRVEPQRRSFQDFSTTMQCCRITSGHCGDIDKVHFVNDKWLLTGCRDRVVMLWNLDAVRNLASAENSSRINLSNAVSCAIATMQPPPPVAVNTDPNNDDGIVNTMPSTTQDAAATKIPAFSVPTFTLNNANAPDDGKFYRRLATHSGWVWTLDSCDNYVSSGGFDHEIHVADLNAIASGPANFTAPAFKFVSSTFVYCHVWNKFGSCRASSLMAGCHDTSLRFYDRRHGEQPYESSKLGGDSGGGAAAANHDDTQVFSLFQESEHKVVASTRRAFYWFDMRMHRTIAEHTVRYNRTQPDYARAMHFSDGLCFIGSVKGQIFATTREFQYEPQWVAGAPRTTPAPLRTISDIHSDLGHVMTVQADSVRFHQPTLLPTPALPILKELNFRQYPNSDCKPLGCTYSEQSGTTAIAAADNTMVLYWPLPQWSNVGVNW